MDFFERIRDAVHGDVTYTDRFGVTKVGSGTDLWIEKVLTEDCIAAWQIIAIVFFALGFPTRCLSDEDERKLVEEWKKELVGAAKYHSINPRDPVSFLPCKSVPKNLDWVLPLSEVDAFMESVGHSLKVSEIVREIYDKSFGSQAPTGPTQHNARPSEQSSESPLQTKERNTLLCIIAALCKESKLPYDKPAKTAGMIVSTAAQMGISLGETTVENHLKKIPDALATRMK